MIVYFCDACNNGQLLLEEDIPKDERCFKCNTYLTMKVINYDEEDNEEMDLCNNDSDQKYCPRLEEDNSKVKNEKDKIIEGRIIGTSNDALFIRNPISKLYEKLRYRQRVSDIQNTIVLRVKGEDKDTRVIFYGIIKGGIGELKVGMLITALGKYNLRNEFVATKVVVETNTLIFVKYEIKDFLYLLIPIALPLLLLGVNYNFQGIGSTVDCNLNKEFIIRSSVVWIILATIIGKTLKKITKIKFFKRIVISISISLALYIGILILV